MDQLVSLIMGCFIFTVVILAIILHTLGIYCMHKNKQFSKIQRVILTNLSVAKLVCIPGFSMDIIFKCMYPHRPAPRDYPLVVKYYGFITVLLTLFSMSLISLDRLLCVTLCLHYRRLVTKRRIIKTVFLMWFLAIAFSSLEIFPPPWSQYFLKFIGSCFFIVTLVTYSTIAYKLKKRNRRFSSTANPPEPGRKTFRKHYVMPFLIVMSFIVIGVLPFDMSLFMTHTHELDVARYTLLSFNIALDPIIYVFLQKELRRTAMHVTRSCSCFCWFYKAKRSESLENCPSPQGSPYMVKSLTEGSIVESGP